MLLLTLIRIFVSREDEMIILELVSVMTYCIVFSSLGFSLVFYSKSLCKFGHDLLSGNAFLTEWVQFTEVRKSTLLRSTLCCVEA
jgi:hypothetical protein